MPRPKTGYRLRIALRGHRASRTICLLGSHTLHDLHEVIFLAFDRSDPHFYSFYLPTGRRRSRSSSARGREHSICSLARPRTKHPDPSVLTAARTSLDSMNLKVGQRFEYLFDFGDHWWHDIEVVGRGLAMVHHAGARPLIHDNRGKSPRQCGDLGEV
jgi:hypothetical protein